MQEHKLGEVANETTSSDISDIADLSQKYFYQKLLKSDSV